MKKRRIHYFFYNLWYLLTKPNRELNYLIQRMTRGWSDKDIWNFDWYLAGIIKGGLKRLKETQFGCPNNLTEKQWDRILDSIIWTFDTIGKTENSGKVLTKRESKKMEKGLRLFIENYFSLWD